MRILLASLAMAVAACGGGGGGSPTSPGGGGTATPNTITIGSGGAVSPRELVVTPGTRVTFVNNDTQRHDMTSDPHPDHQDCPEINQVGVLNPGQRRETGNLVAVRTCGFHDHENPAATGLQGRIVIR